MPRKFFCLALCLFGPLSLFTSRSAEEVCVTCEQKVLVSGDFTHATARGSLIIEGVPRGAEEAFREEVNGPEFTLSIPGLEAGKYSVQFGFAETWFTNSDH